MKKSLQTAIAALSILVASCTDPDHIDIELSGNPWCVEGIVVADDRAKVAGRKVAIIRIDARGTQPVGHVFAATRTDQQGRFYFESAADGDYTVLVTGDDGCTAQQELGRMTSQKKTVELQLRSPPCAIVL